MTYLYYVKCDRCSIVKVKVIDKTPESMFSNGLNSPKNWTYVDGKDYCPECSKKRKQILEAGGFE
jgi:hypothetical protein